MTAAETNQRKGTTMQAQTFDGMARELGQVVTRRSMFRLLGGAAAIGTGLALAAQEESLAKTRGQGNGKAQGKVNAQGNGRKVNRVLICYLNQTLAVPKSKRKNYPGATRGGCPVVNSGLQ